MSNESPNILDKKNKSLVDAFGKAKIEKIKRYDWSTGGKPGVFSWVPKDALNIDGRYQRDEVSKGKVLEIARNWDWALFGVILAVARDDNTLWVFDGGHRTRASFYRSDISELPCMVYELRTLSDEAKAFLGKNLMIANVSMIDKFKALVVTNDSIASKAKKILEERGITVTDNAKNRSHLACIKAFLLMVERDELLAIRVIDFCRSLCGDTPISSAVMRAVFNVCDHFKHDIDILHQFGEKISRHSQREIEVKIRQMRAECGKGGEKIEALALLDLVNKGRRNKLEW